MIYGRVVVAMVHPRALSVPFFVAAAQGERHPRGVICAPFGCAHISETGQVTEVCLVRIPWHITQLWARRAAELHEF